MSKINSVSDLEAQLAVIRENLAQNIDAIVDRTSPKNLWAQLTTKVKAFMSKPVVFIPIAGISFLIIRRFVKKLFSRK